MGEQSGLDVQLYLLVVVVVRGVGDWGVSQTVDALVPQPAGSLTPGDNEKDAYAKHAHPTPTHPNPATTTTAATATATTAAPVRAAFEIPQSNEGWHSTFPQCFFRGREAGRA